MKIFKPVCACQLTKPFKCSSSNLDLGFPLKEQCLRADEPCPEGFYLEYIGGIQEEGALRSLTGRSVSVNYLP